MITRDIILLIIMCVFAIFGAIIIVAYGDNVFGAALLASSLTIPMVMVIVTTYEKSENKEL
jgi:uncharacterized membrane protein YoaK (UPF0700 family)